MKRLAKIGGLALAFVALLAIGAEVGALGTWRYPVPGLLTAGDIIVARNSNNLGNLPAVATGSVLCSQGVGAAPAYCSSFTTPITAPSKVSTKTTHYTVLTTDTGTRFIGTKSTTQQFFTLPAASTAGLDYCFVAGDANGDLMIDPVGSDIVKGKTHGAENGTALLSTATKRAIMNAAATNVAGDHTCLVSDGTSTWWQYSVAGVWAAQQ